MIAEYIIGLLPNTWLARDSFKDGNNQGFMYRFMNSIGLTLDEEITDKVDEALLMKDSVNVEERYLNLLSTHLGIYEEMTLTEYTKRQMLQQIPSIARIRGTVQSYKDLLFFLGFATVNIVETPPAPLSYDTGNDYDTGLNYDTVNTNELVGYTIELTGSLTMSLEIFARMENIRRYLEPINAKFEAYTYNAGPIGDLAVTVQIIDGDLYYNNDADPTLVLTLNSDGSLNISGPNAARYYEQDGDLFFITNT